MFEGGPIEMKVGRVCLTDIFR